MKFLTGVNDGVNEINRVEKEIDELKQVIKHLFEIEIDNLIFDFNVTKQCKESDGGTPEAIKLMGIIREKMIEKNLAYDWTNGEQISKEEIKEKRQQYFRDHSENHYQQSFPNTYELEKNKLLSYYDDGWDYGDSKKHYYYNELDHYLTHLVGNIARNTPIGNNCEEGFKTIREEVNKVIEKERLNSNVK